MFFCTTYKLLCKTKNLEIEQTSLRTFVQWANVLKDVCSIQKTLFFLRKIKHFPSRNNVGDFEGGVFWRRPKQPTSFFTPLYPPKCKNLCFSLGKVRLFEESQIFNSTRNVINLMSAKATPPNLANFESRLMQIVKKPKENWGSLIALASILAQN